MAKIEDGNIVYSSSSDKPRWDILFVERVEEDGRIIVNNERYGEFWTGGEKVRKTVPKDMAPEGHSKKSKFAKLTAISIYLNREELHNSEGIIIRNKNNNSAVVASDSDEVDVHVKEKVSKGSTSWVAYVSPEEEVMALNGKEIGVAVPEEVQQTIANSLTYLEENWG